MNDPKDYSEAIEPAGVTSEVTAEGDSGLDDPVPAPTPKKRGRPPKKLDWPVAETPTPAPLEAVTVVVAEKPSVDPVPAQTVPAQTLAEIEAGRRSLNKYRPG